MWNGLHTHRNTHLSTDQAFYCVVRWRHLESGAFLEMLFWKWEGKQKGKRGQVNICTVATAMEGGDVISRLIRSPPSPR